RDLGLDLYADPDGAIRVCVKEWFPQDIARASYIYQFSASAGIGKDGKLDGARIKFHIFFLTAQPLLPSVMKERIDAQNALLIELGYGEKAGNGAIRAGHDPALCNNIV